MVSVIVPVYNCEENIDKCIDSIVNQSYSNIELILVNDGSTDNSGEICKQYSEQYDNCVYVKKRNNGVSSARNCGLLMSSGKYFLFCDADDSYEIDAIERLVCKAQQTNSDITCGGVKKIFKEYSDQTLAEEFCVSSESSDFGDMLIKFTKNYLLNSPWAKLYKRAFINDCDTFFLESLHCGEDLEWNCRVFQRAKIVAGISGIVYNYYIEDNDSLSNRFSNDYFDRINITFNALVSLYWHFDIFTKYEKELLTIQEQNIWKGFFRVNAINCNLSYSEKKAYIQNGLNSSCFSDYKSRKMHYIGFIKERILSIRNASILLVVIDLLGKINKKL